MKQFASSINISTSDNGISIKKGSLGRELYYEIGEHRTAESAMNIIRIQALEFLDEILSDLGNVLEKRKQ